VQRAALGVVILPSRADLDPRRYDEQPSTNTANMADTLVMPTVANN
jgi:hypothetical protein